MRFKPEGIIEWGRWAFAQLVWLAVFLSFAGGLFTTVPILQVLPLLVHQIIGWAGFAVSILFIVAEIAGWKI